MSQELYSLLLQQTRERARENLLPFVVYTRPHYEPNWHHRLMCEYLDRFISGEIKRLMIFTSPQHGKDLCLNTPIPTPTGWTTMSELKVGDMVFSDQGLPTRVVAKSPVWKNQKLYQVHSSEVEPIFAGAGHEWRVRLCRKTKTWSIRTSEYLAARKTARRPLIEHHPGLVTKTSTTLPIEPWLLGLWLGDGSSHYAGITLGEQDRAWVRARIESLGYCTRMHSDGKQFGVLGLLVKLRAVGLLRNKHIPMVYLRASTSDRLALLQGLIDSDGYVSETGYVEYCSVRKQLAEGCAELVRSLGVKCAVHEGRAMLNGVDCGPKYRVMFYMKKAATLPRRAERCKDGTKHPGLYVKVEETTLYGDTVCIQVDAPSRMFLAGKSMVPTHNSELVSRCLPAYILGRNPDKSIIACSYGADLASKMNRDVQRIIDSTEYREVFPETTLNSTNIKTLAQGTWLRNSSEFEIVGKRGSYRSAGVGGAITGMGLDFGIIDDPIKNQEEAYSSVYRERAWDWYTSTFYTRLRGKDSGILLTLTRWHEDDLAGRLLKQSKIDPKADQWTVLTLPAICEPGKHPRDPREIGEALWPVRYPAEFLLKHQSNNMYVWNALYQQRPAPLEGGIIKRDWLKYYTRLPEGVTDWLMSMDLTFKDTRKGSYVCIQVWCRKGSRRFLVDQVRDRLDFPATIKAIVAMHEFYPQCRTILIEDKANGPAVVSTLKEHIPGIIPVAARGSKEERLHAVSSYFEAGDVWLPETRWIQEYAEELVSFPNAPYDDQVDTTTQALARYGSGRAKGQPMSIRLGVGLKGADERPM